LSELKPIVDTTDLCHRVSGYVVGANDLAFSAAPHKVVFPRDIAVHPIGINPLLRDSHQDVVDEFYVVT